MDVATEQAASIVNLPWLIIFIKKHNASNIGVLAAGLVILMEVTPPMQSPTQTCGWQVAGPVSKRGSVSATTSARMEGDSVPLGSDSVPPRCRHHQALISCVLLWAYYLNSWCTKLATFSEKDIFSTLLTCWVAAANMQNIKVLYNE